MNGYTFLWPWMLAVGVAALLAMLLPILLATTRSRRGRSHSPSVWNLPALLRQTSGRRFAAYRRTGVAALTIVALATITGVALSARPAKTVVSDATGHSRDVVLCLDVSGSTLPFDRQVIAAYRQIVTRFRTERIGMSIFNSTSRTVFPLTDDYSLVERQLDHALSVLSKVTDQKSIDRMSRRDYQAVSDWLQGTQNRHDATSLIGDGLVGCETLLPGFSANPTRRQARVSPASIVFATDNVLSGTPLYTLGDALRLARLNSITVDGLYTGDVSTLSGAQARDLRGRITRSGGTYRTREDANSVSALVGSIEGQQVRAASRSQNVQAGDAPWPFVGALALLVALGLVLLAEVRR